MNQEKVSATFAAKFIRESPTRQRLWDMELGGFYLLSLGNGKGSWRVKYRALDGRPREITIGQYPAMTPEQARKEAKVAINQADTGNDPLQAREDKKQEALKLKEQTMRAYLAGAYSVYQASRKSRQQTLSILQNHFADWLDRPMTELKPADVLAWQAKKMAEGLHFATMTRTYGALHGLLNHAVKYQAIAQNPFKGTTLQKPAMTDDELGQSGGERRYLSIDEVKALFTGLDVYQDKIRQQRRSSRTHGKPHLPDLDAVTFVDHVKPFVLLAYYTGFRSGDLFGLCWEHINFDFGFIRKTIEKTAHHIPEPRTFDLSHAALNVLNLWWLQHDKPKSGFVFPSKSSESGRMNKNAMQTPWATIKKLSGLPIELDLYSLRHNFASQLVMAGADLLTVSKLMAHTDINTTIKHYGHLQPNMARKWVNEFANMTNDSSPEETPVKNHLSQVG